MTLIIIHITNECVGDGRTGRGNDEREGHQQQASDEGRGVQRDFK